MQFLEKGCAMSVAGISTLLTICFLAAPDLEVSPEGGQVSLKAQVAEPLPNYWMTSYDEARKIAARNQLPLLLHFDATWCGACRRMDADVLNRAEVSALLGSTVIGVRVDADHYKHLISEFGISTLPTEVVVMADGTRGGRYVGAVSLSVYTSRLHSIGNRNKEALAKLQDSAEEKKNTRSCLIVKHDGKMVGLGGYSPVALTASRQWKKGTEEFVAAHEGVDYFFQNADEVRRFQANAAEFIPKLHGCDPVALFQQNIATAGAIEYGSFYQGQVFFFASVHNKDRFESNPAWYSSVSADARTENDDSFPFLGVDSVDN
jgi:YHS domain-containing protein